MPSWTSKSSSVLSSGGMNTPALLSRACRGKLRLLKSAAKLRIELQGTQTQVAHVLTDIEHLRCSVTYSNDAKSSCMQSTLASLEASRFNSWTAASPRSLVLDAITTCAFLCTKARAVSRPTPARIFPLCGFTKSLETVHPTQPSTVTRRRYQKQ